MRTMFLAVLLLAAVGVAVADDDVSGVHRVPLLDGVYSVEVPSAWWIHEIGPHEGAVVSETQTSPYKLLISTPVPGIRDLPAYTHLALADACAKIGGTGILLGEGLQVDDDQASIQAVFTVIGKNGEKLGGMLDVVEIAGHAVTLMAVGPAEGFGEFLPKAEAIFNTYEIDADKLDDHHEELEQIGREIVKEMAAGVAAGAQ